MKRAAWTHSSAGLPFKKIALAISANAHAVDQRTIVVRFLGGVLLFPFFFSPGEDRDVKPPHVSSPDTPPLNDTICSASQGRSLHGQKNRDSIFLRAATQTPMLYRISKVKVAHIDS